MTEEKFHFKFTTDDVPEDAKVAGIDVMVPDLSYMQSINAKETVGALLRAVGIRPGEATVTLGSEKQGN